MSSSTPVADSKFTRNSRSSALDACQQCGATDKKLSVCGRCHIEKYCGIVCQTAAWPAHKQVCHLGAAQKKSSSVEGDISEVAAWSGKKFGVLKGAKVIDQNVRILSHTRGFAVFLPKEFWRKLDYQVPISFPEKKVLHVG